MITHYQYGAVTDKKESILIAALELFANDGFNTTSTSKIAKKAGVSEGLIFRHFGNKKGLLDAIVKSAEKRISEVFGPVLFEEDPKEILRKTIQQTLSIDKEEHNFWKLQFKLKWETEYNNPNKMKPIEEKLTWAFKELHYDEPEKEAIILLQILDSIGISVLRDGNENVEWYQPFLLKRYDL